MSIDPLKSVNPIDIAGESEKTKTPEVADGNTLEQASNEPSQALVENRSKPDPDIDLLTNQLEKDNPAGKLHGKYLDEYLQNIEKLTPEDRKKISNSSIEDIRFNARLLKTASESEDSKTLRNNIKEETARRINVYTSHRSGDWYTLDYKNVNQSHEMKIGLGDILIDPDIKAVLIKQNGVIFKVTRGVVGEGHRHSGRLGFTKEDGSYAATFTGDSFRILSNEEMSEEQFAESFKTENQVREENHKEYEEIKKYQGSNIPLAEFFLPNGEIDPKYKIHLDETRSVSQQIEGLSSSQIRMVDTIEREFRKAGLSNINLIGAAAINAIAESALNPSIKGDKGKSIGLFQLHEGGAGKGMSVSERQDPVLNTRRIIQEVKSPYGNELMAKAEAGASLTELTQIFCRDIERPADKAGDMKKRAVMAANHFRSAISETATA